MRIKADMAPMRAAIDRIGAAFDRLSREQQAEFDARYHALTAAGAEWVDVQMIPDGMQAVIGEDMRRLCAEFGITA